MSLSHNPQILFLDEPFNGLDTSSRYEFFDILNEYPDKKPLTIIVAAHHIDDLNTIVDNIIIVDKGNIIESKSLQELTQDTKEFIVKSKTPLNQINFDGIEILFAEESENDKRIIVKNCSTEIMERLENLPISIKQANQLNMNQIYLAYLKKLKRN
jgi:ABC-type multidrug transport system ATPase subunit